MGKVFVSVCLLRLLLPICLTASVCLRQDILTSIYLLLLLYLPFVPLPTTRTMNGHTGFYTRFVVWISIFMSLAQIAFQMVLFMMPPYGHFLTKNCSDLEKWLRLTGFIRLDGASILHVLPEVIMVAGSVVVQISLEKLHVKLDDENNAEQGLLTTNMNKEPTPTQRKSLLLLTMIGKYLSLITLCVASILIPSITTGVLFGIFLSCITVWACYKTLGRKYAYVCRLVVIITFCYIIAIYVYQTQWAQDQLSPKSQIARFVGLQALRITNCTTDPRAYQWNEDLLWPSFALPIVLIILYFIMIYESRMLIFMSLIRGRESVYRRATNNVGTQDQEVAVASTSAENKVHADEEEMMEEPLKVEIMDYLIDALVTVARFASKSSYIATNIIMMTWSITYHSWLTFVLLLWASILWMVPNQRQSMLRSSPFLVVYAEFLLISQFIFGMDLTIIELPDSILYFKNLAQIGFFRTNYAAKPLLIKTSFTVMFWITLRQYMQEQQESRSTSTVAHMMAPVHVTVGAATVGGEPASKGGQIMLQFGEKLRRFLTKFWIWIVTITLFAIGIAGQKMTLFRIVYMALALIFILTFQLSWVIWRKMMYGFWLTVIIISMTILVMVYTYQFEHIPELWASIGINKSWQNDIGLESYETGELLVRLTIPTFFVIITVIQLKYFHKDFLIISDVRSRGTSTTRASRPSYMSEDELPTQTEDSSSRTEITKATDTDKTTDESMTSAPTESIRPSFHLFKRIPNFEGDEFLEVALKFMKEAAERVWLFFELHLRKFILFIVMLVCINDVSAVHLAIVIVVVIALLMNSKIQDILIRLISLSSAILLLAKMVYQIEYFNENKWDVRCKIKRNVTTAFNTAVWLGFRKTETSESIAQLLSGYIWIIMVVTIYVVVMTRQRYVRHVLGRNLSRPRTLFPRITIHDTNKGIPELLKYLLNYGFYRLGVEVTLVAMVILIGHRLDAYAGLYAAWVGVFVACCRSNLARIWYFFNLFVAIAIPLQYVIVIGFPPWLCIDLFITFNSQLQRLYHYLYLPYNDTRPDPTRLIWDFLVLLLATRQTKVFRIEAQYSDQDYPGGCNKSIVDEIESPSYVNPVPDFISHKRCWLDIIKHGVLCSLMWISCAFVFMAGTNSVTLFSLIYVIAAFFFLWQGNDFYLKPIATILKWWNYLLGYNVSVILLKVLLQIPGCVYTTYFELNYCWLVQILGIECIYPIGSILPDSNNDNLTDNSTCKLTGQNAGILWDSICFIFLIFQRRLFCSHHFVRIVDETKAMAILAARGAELIEELSRKQFHKQQESERRILEKIKNKMDSIKAAQKRIQGKQLKEPETHHQAIRSGDYYMFDDTAEQELDNILETGRESDDTLLDDDDDEHDETSPPTVSKFIERALHADSPLNISKPKVQEDIVTTESDECSSCEDKSTDETSSKDVTTDVQLDKPRTKKEMKKIKKEEECHELCECEDEEQSMWERFLTLLVAYVKFFIAFLNSIMVSLIRWLNQQSRDYRYVMHALGKEKKALKETRSLRTGMRVYPSMKWQPMPGTSIAPRRSSTLKIEEFEKQEMDTLAQPTVVKLLSAMYHALMSHSEMVCYFAVFLLQIKNPNALSLPLPLMVFFWGSLTLPRPTKTFWVTVIAYTETIVIVKSIFQSELVTFNNPSDHITEEGYITTFNPTRFFGLEKTRFYALFDLILLLAVFFHRSTLKSLGLWKSTEEFNKSNQANRMMNLRYVDPQSSSIASGTESDIPTEMTNIDLEQPATRLTSEEETAEMIISYQQQTIRNRTKKYQSATESLFAPVKGFFGKLLDPSNKIATDVYAYMFLFDFCNIIVLIVGYSAFGSLRGDGGVTQYIEENKIPFTFLAMLILQFALILVDRSLYLSKYTKGKLIFQYIMIVGVHVWMFFALPLVTKKRFDDQIYPALWYLFKCCYFLLSAHQIRKGYPTRILGNFLTKNYNYINSILFKIFLVIPFLYEVRTLMDWIWTETSMTLPDWIKMEDIFSHVFQLKCARRVESKYPNARGVKVKASSKLFLGGGCLILLITVIWFPLVLFSLGSTVGVANIPKDITVTIKIGSFQPVYQSSTYTINSLNETEYDELSGVYSLSANAQTFLSDYQPEDIGVVQLPFYSSTVWGVPPPEAEAFKKELSDPASTTKIQMEWKLSRVSDNPEQPPTASDSNSFPLPHDIKLQLAKILVQNTSVHNVTIPFLMPKFIKVTATGQAPPVFELMRRSGSTTDIIPYVNITLTLANVPGGFNTSLGVWWNAQEDTPKGDYAFLMEVPRNTWVNKNSTRGNYLTIYTFNNKAFPEGILSFVGGKGIIGLYTTFVIVVSAYVKSFFTGVSFTTMFDDLPNVDRILQLCLDVYLVRERKELDLEEDLFAKLIFLYRSPETLIKWSRPPEEDTQEE